MSAYCNVKIMGDKKDAYVWLLENVQIVGAKFLLGKNTVVIVMHIE